MLNLSNYAAIKRVSALLTFIIALMPVKALALGDYTPDDSEILLFECKCTKAYWTQSGSTHADPITTNAEYGNSQWKTEAFTFYNDLMSTGFDIDYIAKIYTLSPISKPISTATIYVDTDAKHFDKLKSIYLEMADNPDFSNPIKYEPVESLSASNRYGLLVFHIDQPQEYSYYRYCLEFSKVPNNKANYYWLRVSQFSMYTSTPLSAPALSSDSNGSEESFTLRSDLGDLHVLLYEYDNYGNLIREIESDKSSQQVNRPLYVVDADDTSWRNKVAGEGEDYVITRPTESGSYYDLRAKSVLGDQQSAEIHKQISEQGLVTVLKPLTSGKTGSIKWYNLQGLPIENPQTGLFIRIEDGRVTKVRK